MGRFTYKGERAISPPKSVIEEVTKQMTAHFEEIQFGTPAQIAVKVEEKVEKAKYGWDNCTMDFKSRIKALMGPNSRKLRLQKLKKLEKQKKDEARSVSYTPSLGERLKLDVDERAFMEGRYKYYEEDFEFNKSSDQILLRQVIVDEIVLRRLEIERLADKKLPDKDQEFLSREIQERYRRNLDNLGVSRKQRVEQDESVEGNVAQLSESLEEKLNNLKKLSDPKTKAQLMENLVRDFAGVHEQEVMEYIRDLEIIRQHELRPAKNYVSDAELLGTKEDNRNGS